MTNTWPDTYAAYLRHLSIDTESEIHLTVKNAVALVDSFPPHIRKSLHRQLNTWGRDNFICFGGYELALLVIKQAMEES